MKNAGHGGPLAPVKNFITPEKAKHHAEILSNRVKNRFRHLSKRFRRQGIDCFRLYDWDIPEVRAVVDWYAGHVVIAEYVRLQTDENWLPQMAEAVAKTLNIPLEKVHMRLRRTKENLSAGPRYQRIATKGERFVVSERNLKFWVNMDDFLDTGLFSDHRETRVLVGNLAKDKDLLNLYAYTGSFTCAAAFGGARSTTTVDRSATYLDWAKDNLKLNNLWGPQHTLVQSDVDRYLADALARAGRFTLCVVDPPSFFQDHNKGVSFDVNRDHAGLLRKIFKVMAPGSFVFFSTNNQRFEPRLDGLPVREIKELTPKTIPEDYRNKKVHRCWQMTVK